MDSISATSMTEDNKLHIAMFPWLAFGHILPFLELSKSLAQKGHRISFISTPRNIQRLPKIPQNLSPLIDLVKLTLPHDDNLPENAEATIDVPYNKVQYLKKAFDGLEGPLTCFLESSTPDWIIYDFAPHWLPPVAAKLGVPCAFFSVVNAAFLAFMGPPSPYLTGEDSRTEPEHFTVLPKWVPFPSNLAFRLYEILGVFNFLQRNDSGVSDTYRYASTVVGCDFVAVRSCWEYEPEWLRLLEDEVFQKTVIPVGVLPPSAQDSGDEKDDTWHTICDWLDKQDKRAVVYIALGSEATLSQEELTELALGLELSELPFFWVLRKSPSLAENESPELPDGFEDRTKGRGVVCTSWAPQLKILAHPSVGGFLTHCGWGSIIEGLEFGCALILLPFLTDQGLNARVLEEKMIGVEIPRDERDGSFTKESVTESLKLVMVDEEGMRFRAKAREMKEIFGNRELQDRYTDDFLRGLRDHKRSI